MIDPTALKVLLYWVHEREMVRLQKAAERPWPWTRDKILQTYRFCNVRREDDRVTKWIDENIRQPFSEHPHLWFMLCIARQINWPDTLQELITSPDAWPADDRFCPERLTWVLDTRKARGDKVYTGAYMIRAESDKNKPWYDWTKQRYMAEIVLGKVWEDRAVFQTIFDMSQPSIAELHERLMRYHGWGPFMAYQVCVDLRFTRYLKDAPDRETWCAAGPGTLRGLNRLHGRPVAAPQSQTQALKEIRELYPIIQREAAWGIDFSDVPNVLCEFDKYMRVKLGEGRPRTKYEIGRGS